MRVLLVTPFPPMRAPEGDHAYSLCERLAEYGLDIQVVTARGSLPHPRIPVHRILRDWGWADVPRLAWLIRRCRPDAILLVYVGWVYRYHPMMTFVPSLAKRLVPQARVVTWFHVAAGTVWPRALRARAVLRGMRWWVGRQGADLEFGTLFRDSDRIVVPSEGIRAALAERSMDLRPKSVLIPPPSLIRTSPDDDGTIRGSRRAALGLKPDDTLIVYFGYIYPSKGLEYLIEALQIVTRRRHPRARLVIVGGSGEEADRRSLDAAVVSPVTPDGDSSYAQRLRDLVRALRLDERVTWAGGFQWDSDEPSQYLRAADVCVLPFDQGASLRNSSMAAVASHGLPIVTTESAPPESAFIHRENMLLCPPKDPDALATALETLIDDPALAQRLRAGALTLAREWFQWETAVQRLVASLAS